MFRLNNDHKQIELFTASNDLQPAVARRLKNSWAPVFHEHVFAKLKRPFSIFYSEDTGRPNFPVNILVGLEISAAMHGYTVEQT
ncbi:MAG: hypothetical protein GX316_11640 [Firmicutes bacterium]|nr:hypothetical protein [Bacillota bacterium]